MMDIFKLNFGSKLVKGMITKVIRKYVKKQFGIDIQLELDQLDIDYNDSVVKGQFLKQIEVIKKREKDSFIM